MVDKEARLEELIAELQCIRAGKESINILSICDDPDIDDRDIEGKTQKYFSNIKEEEKILFSLKELLIHYYDELLVESTMEAWDRIILWYQKLGTELAARFWEFSILRTILLAYKTENENYNKGGNPVSVLQFSNMNDIYETYFRVLFLCRRLEYDVTDGEELIELIHRRKLSLILVNYIIERARIYNKGKVRDKINALMGEYGNR